MKNCSANSVYDPNRLVSGHQPNQPHGHDQFALLYHHCEVTGAVIKNTFANGNTDRDGQGHAILGIRLGGAIGVGSSRR
jgi:hypothetical protein